MLFVGDDPVIVPLSYAFVPSRYTWKTTEPFGPTSSSTPMSLWKAVQPVIA